MKNDQISPLCHPQPRSVPHVEAAPCLYLETIKVVPSAFDLVFEMKSEGTEEGMVPQGWSPEMVPGVVPQEYSPRSGPPRGGPQESSPGWSPQEWSPRGGPKGCSPGGSPLGVVPQRLTSAGEKRDGKKNQFQSAKELNLNPQRV